MSEPEPDRLPSLAELRPALVAGVVLGVVAAVVVWYLERFETRRVISEAEDLLRRHAAFDEFLRARERGEE